MTYIVTVILGGKFTGIGVAGIGAHTRCERGCDGPIERMGHSVLVCGNDTCLHVDHSLLFAVGYLKVGQNVFDVDLRFLQFIPAYVVLYVCSGYSQAPKTLYRLLGVFGFLLPCFFLARTYRLVSHKLLVIR